MDESTLNNRLERECEWCKGRGKHEDGKRCRECDGAGYFATEFGEEVLNFIRRHLQVA